MFATTLVRQSQVIHVRGSLRAPVSTGLRYQLERLLEGGAEAVVLDLAEVSEIDAAGVGELVHLHNLVTGSSGTLRIVNPAPNVRHVLARVGLLDLLTRERI